MDTSDGVLVALLLLVIVGSIVGVASADGHAATDGDEPFAVVPHGVSVDASVEHGEVREVEEAIAAEMDLERRHVRVDADVGTVEVLTDVEPAAFADALDAVGVDTDGEVRDRPTSATVDRLEVALGDRYEVAGVNATVTARGAHLLVDPASGDDGVRARELATTRGAEMWALVPGDDDPETVTLLTASDFSHVGSAQQDRGLAYVPLTVAPDAAADFQASMRDLGFADEGGTTCGYDLEASLDENRRALEDDRCLLTVAGGEVVFAARVTDALAEQFREGTWDDDPTFRTSTVDLETAQELELLLRTGDLPAETSVYPPEDVPPEYAADASDDEDGAEGLGDVVGEGAGFGPLVALAGLLGALVLARRRRP